MATKIPLYSVVKMADTLFDKKRANIIAQNCDVVVLAYTSETTVLVCAFGDYKRSVVADVNLLMPYQNGK